MVGRIRYPTVSYLLFHTNLTCNNCYHAGHSHVYPEPLLLPAGHVVLDILDAAGGHGGCCGREPRRSGSSEQNSRPNNLMSWVKFARYFNYLNEIIVNL